VLLGPGRERLAVDGDERADERLSVTDDEALVDEGMGPEPVLQDGGRDVLAAGRHEDLLLAAGDADESLVVDLADVAGVEPAAVVLAVEDLRRGGVVVPVAAEDLGAPEEELAVVGDGEPFIGALVTIDADTFEQWAEARGRKGHVADLVDDPDLVAEVQRAVDDTNAAVSQAEAIRRFTILPLDWSEEAGHLTPSLKLKRAVVMRQFRREVAALYGR
jgi:hypothetical protein